MAFRWHYENADGAATDGPAVTFEDQAEAEDWLGRKWPSLLDAGVEAVTLLDGDDAVYGPMSLRPD